MNAGETSRLIEWAGGDSAFGRLLGIDDSPGWQQRVHNWHSRGLPAEVELEHYEKIQKLRASYAQQRSRGSARATA